MPSRPCEFVVSLEAMNVSSLYLKLGFLIALAATTGSLFFSDVLGYPPCVLCWYQRIFMYPLVLIFGVSLWTGERAAWKFAMPLVSIGLVFAVYHNLLYYHVIPESITPCVQGVSCTSRQVEWLGFITIPLLSLTAFVMLSALSFVSLIKGSASKGSTNEE